MRRPCILGLLALTVACLHIAAVPDQALKLRNLGFAELENEQPANAEKAFRELLEIVPDDPLAHANLAIALLRQQRFDESMEAIDKALRIAPGRGDLLAIRAEIFHWSGRPEEALAAFRRAAAAAPDDVEIQYGLYRQATTAPVEGAEAAAGEALDRLVRLRPDNLPVLVQQGRRALEAGDRAAASKAFLRIGELAWQAPEAAGQMLDLVLEALEAGDLEAARVPSQRLENVLKVTAMHKEGLRELSTGIQGIPVARFADEPEPRRFGDPVPIRFAAERWSGVPALSVTTGDFDQDQRQDAVWVGKDGTIHLRLAAAGEAVAAARAVAGALSVLDLDNDGHLDLLTAGGNAVSLSRGGGDGTFGDATRELGLATVAGAAATPIDFDIEGDLDLFLGGGEGPRLRLLRNSLEGPLEPVGDKVFTGIRIGEVRDVVASDLDRDGDLDLALATADGVVWLDNLRQGEFRDRTSAAGLEDDAPAAAVASADLDGDGWPDLIQAGSGVAVHRNLGGRFEAWDLGLGSSTRLADLAVEDFDNDGRLDLAVVGPRALAVATQEEDGGLSFVTLEGAPPGGTALAPADLDGDGDVDLLVAGAEGVHLLRNEGGNANGWLSVRLRGLVKGNSKNNVYGLGASLELRAGRAYQFREATRDVTHFGLGSVESPNLLRVVWTNGVPQNRIAPRKNAWIVEEQVLKGSCPFLYAWDGERIRFVTDLLWTSPAGLALAEGVWAAADPTELVRIGGLALREGAYDLRITEELWEAAFFDYVRLWVVDHPEEIEVASSLRFLPGAAVPEEVRGTAGLRPPAAAWDAAGREVTAAVRDRDEVYADGWEPSAYQGVPAERWTFTFDLGEAPAAPVRLHLAGWIFPSDASLNLALAQRTDIAHPGTALEMDVGGSWETLLPEIGHPAGKTKTMVVDTPPLPEGVRRLRIVSGRWLSWDRLAWSTTPADEAPQVVARLAPSTAALRYRGFSALRREAPNAPHSFDYARTTRHSPWLPFPGRYTRYGDVRELLEAPDDRSVILAAGDEIKLLFDAASLPAVPPGWRRTLFLESHGWDKDADRNTWEAQQVEPLPFRAMSGYPYGPDEAFPDTPVHRQYRERWLTRVVAPNRPAAAGGR